MVILRNSPLLIKKFSYIFGNIDSLLMTVWSPLPGNEQKLRGASCLILGFTNKGRPLHVVCGRLEEDEILIITAYEPDSKEWEADWKTRKEITYGG